ncbi:hypothetical protein CPB83DRAFT_853875 [Crepidotus variabilis]|uniref:F-box domain-containing protein n=1 Tax=Crepidotus variabilis TaxID=179855 RepID=A0A9P6EHM2_9AGAR|nr:hypothetical protein CPB83DRAFT_853875 [Crepidotus variabilis]
MLPNELWLEIIAFAVLSDPTHVSLGNLAQTSRSLYAMCNPLIHAYMAKAIEKSGMPTKVEGEIVKHAGLQRPVGGRKSWLEGCVFKLLSFWLGRNETVDTTSSVRYMMYHSIDIKSITIQCQAPSFTVLNAILNSSVRCSRSLTLHGVFTYETVRGKVGSQDGPFIFSSAIPEVEKIKRQPQPRFGLLQNIRTFNGQKIPVDAVSILAPQAVKRVEGNGNYVVQLRTPRHTVRLPKLPLALINLDLTTPSLFSASMYPWTLHVLNQAPLTRLSINVKLSTVLWAHILPAISIPFLRELIINNSPLISFTDLLTFLSRHSTLQVLDLTRDTPLEFPPSTANSTAESSISLPSLSTLRAPPSHTLPFIQYFKLENIPELRTINLKTAVGRFSHLHTAHQYREHMLFPTFEYLSQLPAERKFSLQLTAWSFTGLLEWFVSSDFRTGQENTGRCLSSIDQVAISEAPRALITIDKQMVQKAVYCMFGTDGSPRREPLGKLSMGSCGRDNLLLESKDVQLEHILDFVCPGAVICFLK